jgi:2,3-bisphosphoglycerate-independent phosphoglycerate mutase
MKTALIILDGMGLSGDPTGNAVTPASMPFLFAAMRRFGYARLEASGDAVGLRKGVVGNSETGHLTIGAGHTVTSTLCRTDTAYADGSWRAHPLWKTILRGERLHIVGLLSDAGVHAHLDNLWRCAQLAVANGAPHVVIHPLLDGVDSPSGSAPHLLAELEAKLASIPRTRLGMIMGRKWFCERSASSAPARFLADSLAGIDALPCFDRQSLDSMAHEHDFAPHGYPQMAGVQPDEAILLTSHRADRAIQAARILKERYRVYSLIPLGAPLSEADAFFPAERLSSGVALELAAAGLTTSRIAEACKFPHVTSFFDGLNEIESRRFSIPTPSQDELPNCPEMAINEVVATTVTEIMAGSSDLLIVNIANLDQIGHLGRLDLAIMAARHTDRAAQTISDAAGRMGWNTILLSDHGNADQVETADGRPFGSHTLRPVPLTLIPLDGQRHFWSRKAGTLANVGATVLASLGLRPPASMRESLLSFSAATRPGHSRHAASVAGASSMSLGNIR